MWTQPAPGDELAGYRIESYIARGGMAVVYRARDIALQRPVALKLIAPELAMDEQFRKRFMREPELAAAIDHPNIIPIYRAGEQDGCLYIAMRYVDGEDLGAVLKGERQLTTEQVLSLFTQVASALDAAHAAGAVHRDVKPANILLTGRASDLSTRHVYLTDFGLTKRSSSLTELTSAGQFVGTIHYVAPEQIAGGTVGGTADVYSLGCVLYQALTGQPPFLADHDAGVLWAHMSGPVPSVSDRRPDLPPAVDGVLGRAMAKDPACRPATCGALMVDLTAALAGPVPANGSARPERAGSGAAAADLGRPLPDVGAATVSHPTLPPRADTASPPESPARRGGVEQQARRRRRLMMALLVGIIVVAFGAAAIWRVMARQQGRPTAAHRPRAATAAPAASVAVPTVLATVRVGSGPQGAAVSPDGHVYITNLRSNTVSVMDVSTSRIIATIRLPAPPQYVAVAPTGHWAYITTYNDSDGSGHAVRVMNTATDSVVATVPVGLNPYAPAVTPDGRFVYVPDHGSHDVRVINTRSNSVIATIIVPPNPHWVSFTPDGRRAYVADHESNLVSVIDTASKSVIAKIPVGQSPHSVAVTPNGREVFVADYDAGSVQVIDTSTSTVTATIPVGANPQCVTVARDGRHVYVTNDGSGTLSVIDTANNRVTATVPVGSHPWVVAVAPDGRRAYVTNNASNTVSVLQTARGG